MAKQPKQYWITLNGIMQRFYEKISRTFVLPDKTRRTITLNNVTISVPQSLEEVEEHSVLSALELCQWSIAYKKYLQFRDAMDLDTTQKDVAKLEEIINSGKVGKKSEMKVETRVMRAMKDADLTPEQKLLVEERMKGIIDDILNS